MGVDVRGRIPHGLTRTQAEAELSAVAAAAATPEPGIGLTTGVRLDPAGSRFSEPDSGMLVVVVTIVLTILGLVVLLACVNVANLQLASAIARRREIGIRLAIGADRSQVLAMILKQGLTLAVAGIAVGVVAAFGLTRLMQSLLYEVGAADPLTFVTVPVALLVVAVLASLIPARRATQVSPTIALRTQ